MVSQVEDKNLFKQLKERLEALPKPITEESILLRVLVQALVIIGIIATDVAAGFETRMSLWAVPLSIVGAIFSWRRRKKQNVAAKFLLAIGMLAVLFAFFGNLFASLNDTRLVLAQLLVQLQVLHSFDLPRRKDLGYSMVIGLILLGVAGTVSQTLAFAPALLLFLIIAIPTLVLDYRSRLGLEPIDKVIFTAKSSSTASRPLSLKNSPLSPKSLILFLLITLVLGLGIFAVMPRFPGYQLRTFPVSGPKGLENQGFDEQNRGIANPGYVREGEGSGSGVGTSPEKGPGEVDDTYYYGFNQTINQNLRGEMKRKLVMRVRSQAPGYWRVLGFDRYTGQGWEISREDQQIDFKRFHWSYRFTLTPISPPPTKAETKQIIQTFSAVADLPNLIPVLSYPKHLYFSAEQVAIDAEGGVRSPFGLLDGLTYTVVSKVPYRIPADLAEAPTNYEDYLQTDLYLQIPPAIADKVRQKAEELIATAAVSKSDKEIDNPYYKAFYLAQALKQQYKIQAELPFFGEDEDLVESFLFRYQGGYPDHFSTVLTIMLRSLGIPARLAVGFGPGQFNPFTGYYLVHNTDAYAVTEVYFPEYGWFAFDPIPGHETIPPSFDDNFAFGLLRQFWNWIAGRLPSPVTSFIATLWQTISEALFRFITWLWGFFSGSLLGLLLGLISLLTLSFLVWLGLKGVTIWLGSRRLAKLPPMERLYLQMLDILKDKGYPKHPAQTPLEYAHISHQHHQADIATIIEEISIAYVHWRYGQYQPDITHLTSQLNLLFKHKSDRRFF